MKSLLILLISLFTLLMLYSPDIFAAGETTWYLAEGCTSGIFDTWVLIQNPNSTTSSATITFMDQDGNTQQLTETIPPNSRSSYNVNSYLPNKDVSTKITSDVGVIAERAMYWTAGGVAMAGGHCSIGASSTATVWYLAEGCTSGDFDTWVLIQNPNSSTAAPCTITFMDDNGNTQQTWDTVPANSRRSYNVSNYMDNSNVSTKIESTGGIGIIAERAMYWTAGGVTMAGGHCTLGIPATSTTWYLAEGCTTNFDEWVLIQNPNSNTSAATITFMDQDGNTQQLSETVPPNSRRSYYVNNYMADKDVSTKIVSDVAVVCERAMYWSAGGVSSAGGHCSVGTSGTATTWYLAEGCTNGFDEYVLIQNPNVSSAASVRITFMDENGTTQQTTDSVAANSRQTYNVSSYMPTSNVSTKIESTNNLGIIVERAMYWSGDNDYWLDGHASIGVKEDTSEGGPGGGDGDDSDDGDGGGGGDGSNPEEEAYLLWHTDMEPVYYCPPAVGDDGTIYVGTIGGLEYETGQNAAVYAINSAGVTQWTYPIEGTYKPVGGAIVIDATGNLYFIVEHFFDGTETSQIYTYLYSLTSSGSLRWISDNLYTGDRGWGSHNPAIGSDGTIYAPAKYKLYAFNADGTAKWSSPYEFKNAQGDGAWGMTNPAIDSSGVIYVNVSMDDANVSGVWALEDGGSSATLKWHQISDLSITQMASGPPAIDESYGRLYVGRGGEFAADAADSRLYALNLSDGSLVWQFATDSKTVFATPAIGSDGTIYVGTSSKPVNTEAGIFYAINPDGTQKWQYDTEVDFPGNNTDTYSSAAIGDDGTIYVTPEGKYLYAFNPDGTMKKKYNLFLLSPASSGSASIVFSSIAIGSDGTLYCGDFYHTFDNDDPSNITHTGALYAIDTESTGLASTQWPKFGLNNKNTSRK